MEKSTNRDPMLFYLKGSPRYAAALPLRHAKGGGAVLHDLTQAETAEFNCHRCESSSGGVEWNPPGAQGRLLFGVFR